MREGSARSGQCMGACHEAMLRRRVWGGDWGTAADAMGAQYGGEDDGRKSLGGRRVALGGLQLRKFEPEL